MQTADQPTVIRFAELRKATKSPPDAQIEKYVRDRFHVLGRTQERQAGAAGAGLDIDLNFGLMRCEAGRGNGSHAHPRWEIFIVLKGRWKMTLEGGCLDPGVHELEMGPWDMILTPPKVFHAATNVGEDEGWLLSLNPGSKGEPYWIHPALIAELKAFSEELGVAGERGTDV